MQPTPTPQWADRVDEVPAASRPDETRPAAPAPPSSAAEDLDNVRPASQIDVSLTDLVHGFSGSSRDKARCAQWRQLIRIPDSELRSRWDISIVILVVYTLLVVPYSSAFTATLGAGLLAVDYVIDAIFLADIGLNFATYAYEHSGDLVTQRSIIASRYLRGHFAFDAVAALPTFVEPVAAWNRAPESTFFRGVRLLRLFRVARVLKYEKTHYNFSATYRMLQLFLSFTLLCHSLACIMFVVFADEHNIKLLPPETTEALGWGFTELSNATESNQYSVSLYLTLCMLIGEDTGPSTNAERYYTSVVLLVGACFYATIFGAAVGQLLGSVALLVKNFDAQKSMYYEKMDEINLKMELMGLSDEARQRVKSYYMYIWKRLKSFSGDKNFLDDLPFKLRAELAMSMHKEMVSRVPLFKAAEEKFISDVVVRLTPQINMPGDTIIVEGERGDRMFFVSSGQVEVVNRDDLVLKVLSRGDYVGELALLSDEPRAASAMARTFCELQVLTKEHFDEIIRDWPNYLPTIQRIADERVKKTNRLVRSNSGNLQKTANEVLRKGASDKFSTMMHVQKAAKRWKKLIQSEEGKSGIGAEASAATEWLPGQVPSTASDGPVVSDDAHFASDLLHGHDQIAFASDYACTSRRSGATDSEGKDGSFTGPRPESGSRSSASTHSSKPSPQASSLEKPMMLLEQRIVAVEQEIDHSVAELSDRVNERLKRFEQILQAAMQQHLRMDVSLRPEEPL